METPLALLRESATVAGSVLRCHVIPNLQRRLGTVVTLDGQKCPYSLGLITRVGSAPTVGDSVTVQGVTGVVSAVALMDPVGPWMRHARVYVTTRTDVTGPLITTVTIYPSVATRDGYNTPVRAPSAAGIVKAARIEPVAAAENEADGQRRTQTWTLTVDGDLAAAGVDAYATVKDTDDTRYALVGDPLVRTDPTYQRWSTATMRRTGPGTA